MNPLPVVPAYRLASQPEEKRWLIEGIWSEQAVGLLGGQPKTGKSLLALDMAVAVASGTPCLRRFQVREKGPVLLYAAEDALHVVRQRLEAIAEVAGVGFETLDVQVITAPTVRIDLEADRHRLRETVASLRPRLLVLDPFVRIHACDENVAGDVAPLLAYLRELQRQLETAVVLVHHARKAGHARAGQALRGSTELHAWGDSYVYLSRRREHVQLTVEHRAAPSDLSLALELEARGGCVTLHIVDENETLEEKQPVPVDRVLQVLTRASQPMTRRSLRDACRMRASTVGLVLSQLLREGRIVEEVTGYRMPTR